MKKTSVSFQFTENFSYKVVALFIAIILWLTILNRREHVMETELKLNLNVGSNQRVLFQSHKEIKVYILTSRANYKKWMAEVLNQPISIDLSKKQSGSFDLELTAQNLNITNEIKLKKITPSSIRVELEEVK